MSTEMPEEQTSEEGRRLYQGPTYGITVRGSDEGETLPALECWCRTHSIYVTETVPTVVVPNQLGVRAVLKVFHYDNPVIFGDSAELSLEPDEVVEINPEQLGPSDGKLPFVGTVTVVLQPAESEEFSAIQERFSAALVELYTTLGHEAPVEGADEAVRELLSRVPLQYGLSYMSEEHYLSGIAATEEYSEGEGGFFLGGFSMVSVSVIIGEGPIDTADSSGKPPRSLLGRILGLKD